MASHDHNFKGLWRPIVQLKDKYQQPLMIASRDLIDLDFNPEGISVGYWQDDEGWIATGWDSCNDEPVKVVLAGDAVTHFLIPESPYDEENEATHKRDEA